MIINSVIFARNEIDPQLTLTPLDSLNQILFSNESAILNFKYEDQNNTDSYIQYYLNEIYLYGAIAQSEDEIIKDITNSLELNSLNQLRIVASNYSGDITKLDYNILYGYDDILEMTFSETQDGNYGILSYTGTNQNLILPNYMIGAEGLREITTIEENAFKNTSIETITLGNKLKFLNFGSFYHTNLITITLPQTIEIIGGTSFAFCIYLTSIYVLAETPPVLTGTNTFDYGNNNLVIYVPVDSVNSYKTATGWSEYAERIEPII